MKRLLLLAIAIFLASSVCYSMPDYDPNYPTKTYDNSANMELFKKLDQAYDKKYIKKVTDDYHIDTAPMGAYQKEVIKAYALQKDNTYHYINK